MGKYTRTGTYEIIEKRIASMAEFPQIGFFAADVEKLKSLDSNDSLMLFH